MKWDIENAEYVDGYKISLTFRDGKVGIIDLQNSLNGKVFEPLKDIENFKRFSIHPEIKILTWESGADIAPEFAYENAITSDAALAPISPPPQQKPQQNPRRRSS